MQQKLDKIIHEHYHYHYHYQNDPNVPIDKYISENISDAEKHYVRTNRNSTPILMTPSRNKNKMVDRKLGLETLDSTTGSEQFMLN
jgi:hypothetical protein